VYVDNILISETNQEIKEKKKSIKKFKIKDIGGVKFVMGKKFNKILNEYILYQTRYINDILNKFNINNLIPVKKSYSNRKFKLKKQKIQ